MNVNLAADFMNNTKQKKGEAKMPPLLRMGHKSRITLLCTDTAHKQICITL